MKIYILILLFLLGGITLFAQDPALHVEGKLIVEDDQSPPIAGAIRFNEQKNTFEGYINQEWIVLGGSDCSCATINSPFYTSPSYTGFNLLSGGEIQISIEFSHVIDISSVDYGTNVIIGGSSAVSSNASLVWSDRDTKLTLTTNESWFDLSSSCFDGFYMQILGEGANPILSINGKSIDADRDGCCGGSFYIDFEILC